MARSILTSRINKKLEDQLNEFRLNHYKHADFEGLNSKLVSLFKKFNRIKDQKKRNNVVLEVCTLYFQSMELFFISANAASTGLSKFPSALFINNANLRRFITERFLKTTKYSNWFFTNYIFFIQGADKDKKLRFPIYTNLIRECAEDYLKHYDLLNAYKHGFRVKAKFNKTTLSIVNSSGQRFTLDESDSTITYFSKETRSKIPIIFENTLNFKIGRLFGKALFISTLLNNIKQTVLYGYKEKIKGNKVARFLLADPGQWGKTAGGSHFKKPIFQLAKKQWLK